MNDITDAKHIEAVQLCQSQALRIAEIHPSPTNPRKTFPEDEMAEMIASVKRHGVMSPILVRPWPAGYAFEGDAPKYELIAGERRYRAAKAAGLEYISGTVRDLDDHETLELQIIENLHRKDLNELEEAEGYEMMIKRYSYTAEQLAEKIEKSKAYIYARLKLTAACEVARQAFRAGTLDASRLLLIARIPTARLQEQALEEITEERWNGPMNYRSAAKHVQDKYMLKLAEAPFPRGDADLLPDAGKCHPCPKRTGSNPELYPDVKSADICTDPECFSAKKLAHFARVKSEAKNQGKAVIDGKAAEKLLSKGEWNIAGFHKLDDKCYEAKYDDTKKSYPTYRELLAEQNTPVTLIEKPDGTLIEAVDEKAFKEIAADVGAKTKEASRDHDKERLAKEKAENEFRGRLFAQIRTAYQEEITELQGAPTRTDMLLIARQFFSCIWHESQKKLASLWVTSDEKIDAHERIQRLTDRLGSMTQSELFTFMIDCSLIGMTHVSGYQSTDTPERLLEVAQRMLLSPDTIRRELQAEQEEKAARKTGKGTKAAAPAAEPEEPEAAEVQPETATSTHLTTLNAGDIVVVKADAVSMEDGEGWPLSSRGKSGTIVRPDEDHGWYIVKIGDGEEVLHQDCLTFIASDTKTAEAAQEDSEPTTRKPTSKIEILYRHPENADLAWTGRGRKPKWVEVWLEKGGTLEQLLAKKRPAHKPKGTKAAACEISTPRCDKTLELAGIDVAQPAP